MSRPSESPFRVLVLLLALLAAAAISGLGTPAHALTNIRFERWNVPEHIRPENAPPPVWRSFLNVTFDATVTAADLASGQGLRFAIAERTPGGNHVLAQLEITPCATLPPVGADVYIYAGIELVCTADGRLKATQSRGWTATWCELPQQQVCTRDNSYPLPALPAATAEAFEFVLLDENGQEGAFPTPDDVAICDPVSGSSREIVSPEFADSGKIGIYADPGANLCSGLVEPLVPFRWYVVANLAGMTRCGITTLEMGAGPLPPGFFVNVIANPNAFAAIGTLFGGQAVIGFNCERGASDLVVLYTLEGVTTTPVQDFVLPLGIATPPSNADWPYPWADLCPFPRALRRRLVGSDFIINPAPGHECDTTVRVEAKSWGAMKALYR